MRRKRILFVEQNTDGTIGGSHHSLLLLVQHLDRDAFEPIVAFYERHALIEEFERCARVVLLPSPAPILLGPASGARSSSPVAIAATLVQKAVNVTRSAAAVLARMAIVVSRLRPDVIHMNNSVITGAEWPIAARLCGAPIVAHQRGFGPPTWYAGMFDRIICISRAVRDDLIERAPQLASRAVQIHNGIDIKRYVAQSAANPVALRRELGVADHELIIGLVGNLQSWKGQDVLLRALPALRTSRPWRCLLIGGTPSDEDSQRYHAQLLDIARGSGLDTRVTFTGYRRDVAAVIGIVDVLVHTSVAPEPFGRVILEGMALAKPVVATDQGGPREIIEPGRTGFLVAPGDRGALAQCLDQLLESEALRAKIGAAAAARVADHFTAAAYAARVEETYRTLWPARDPGAIRPVNRAGSDAR